MNQKKITLFYIDNSALPERLEAYITLPSIVAVIIMSIVCIRSCSRSRKKEVCYGTYNPMGTGLWNCLKKSTGREKTYFARFF